MFEDAFLQRYQMAPDAVAPQITEDERVADGVVCEFCRQFFSVFLRIPYTVRPTDWFWELVVDHEVYLVGLRQKLEGVSLVTDEDHVLIVEASAGLLGGNA